MKNFTYFFAGMVFTIMAVLAFDAEAHDHKHNIDLTINHNYPPDDTNGIADFSLRGISDEEFDKAQAMSAAGDTCVFDYAPGWQGCVGGGWYGSQSAINGSIVTRVDNFALRLNIQSDTDFDEQAVGIGGSWHF